MYLRSGGYGADQDVYKRQVGDSRLYLIHDGAIRQITRDHSYVEEMVAMGTVYYTHLDHRSVKNEPRRILR